jgi:hypothetical protein
LANPPFERFTGSGFKNFIRGQPMCWEETFDPENTPCFPSAEGIDRLYPGPVKGFETTFKCSRCWVVEIIGFPELK